MEKQPLSAKAVFDQALELELPAEREAYLDRACAAAPAVRQKVEALLAAYGQAGSFLESPPSGLGDSPTVNVSPAERPGAVIGPYKLMEQIGEGGMGLVFVAEQQHPVRRRVALKLIKPGMDTREVIARFEAERQALALMDHPNIARVLDAGTTGGKPGSIESGRPYFVMELVRGLPITEYCDQNQSTTRERLELFVDVCQAVQHAHQKGIIHRDIKPSNVMVALHDATPVVKVIDFGVAKAIGQQLTDHTVYTAFTQMIGTPLYMSPEQAGMSSLDVDTRSDIYSLGVLLYELLTGTTPFDKERLRKAEFDEVRRIIREEEPPKPSTRISTLAAGPLSTVSAQRRSESRKLSQSLRGELDWIVMKALEKDRSRRYETASNFAADVQRYLNDEAVQACPPSARYRFRKFARRNQRAVATAGVILLVLVVGTAISAWQALRATQAEGLAGERLQTANANYQTAEEQRQSAKTQEGLAKEQRGIAIEQEGIAKKQELLARRRFYAAQMNLAMQAWEAGQPARVLELLESQRPRFDEEDLRAFEWYYLWRLCQGRQRFRLPTQSIDDAQPIAYSPDGKTVASGYNRTVKIWDVATGRQQAELTGHQQLIHCLAYAPDGKTLASSGETVKLWDLATGKERANLDAKQSVGSLSFTADSNTLVMGGNVVKVWDLTTGREEAALGAAGGEKFQYVAVAPDGKTVAAGGEGGTVRVWTRDGTAWRDLAPITGHGWQAPVAISPDGQVLAVGRSFLKLYDLATGKERLALQGHTGPIYSIAFADGGKTLVSAGQDRTVRVWDTVTGQQQNCLAHSGPVNAVAAAPDGKMLAAMTSDAVRLWDVTPLAEQMVLRHGFGVGSVAYSPDGKALASLGSGVRKFWDPVSGQETPLLPAASIGGERLAFSPDGKSLVTSGGPDNGIEVWDVTGGRQALLQGHTKGVNGLAMSPDGKMLATASNDSSAILWDLGTRRARHTVKVNGEASAVAFSPDGKTLAVGAQFNVVKLYEAATGKELAILQRMELAVTYTWSLVFSPNGKMLAAGDREGIIRVWDLATGRLHASLRGHTDSVWSLDFSADGKTLASASDDRTVRLWDVATGQERMTLKGHQGAVTSVAFAPDGNTLATGSNDGTVRLWRAATDAAAQARQKELDPDSPETPAAHNERGDRLWQNDRTGDAEKAYGEALARLGKLAAAFPNDPGYPQEMVRSLLSLNLLLAQRKRPEEAEQARQQAQELYGKLSSEEQEALVFAYLQRGRKLGASGKLQAERTYSQAIELAPGNHRTWINRGTVYRDLGQHQLAIADFSRALELAPENAGVWFGRAFTYGTMGQHEKARADYSKVIELDSNNASAWNNRANCYERLGQQDEAIVNYSKAVELKPSEALYWQNCGRIHTRLRQWDKAVADYSKVIELKPGDTAARNNRGNAYFNMRQLDNAMADYSKVRELDPKHFEAWYQLGRVQSELGRRDDMIAGYAAIFSQEPTSAEEWQTRAQYCIRLGLWEETAAHYAKAFPLLESANAQVCYQHAVPRLYAGDVRGYEQICTLAHQRFGDTSDPVTAYQLAMACLMSAEPTVPPAELVPIAERAVAAEKLVERVVCLAMAYYRAGQYDRAVQTFQECVEMDANWDRTWVHSFLAMAQYRQGRAAEARQALEEATRDYEQQTKLIFDNNVGHLPQDWWHILQSRLHYQEAWALIHGAPLAEDARLWVIRGRSLAAIGRSDEAAGSFAKAAQLQPDDLTIFVRCQPPAKTLADLEVALTEARGFLAAHPQQTTDSRVALARRHLSLTPYLHKAERHEEAEAALAQALDISQDDPNIRFQRGTMYVSVGRDDAALADFSALIDSGKEGLNLRLIHTHRAAVYVRMGQFENAAGDYECAWKLAPQEADTNNNLAWLLATCSDEKLRDPARAVMLAQRGVELAPKNWMYRNTLGVAHYRAGHWQAAIDALNEAVQLEPEKVLAFNGFFLAMAHWRLGNKLEARAWRDRSDAWLAQNRTSLDNDRVHAAELECFQLEAAELLGIKE